MESIIRNLTSVLAEAFWLFNYTHLITDFKQRDGKVIRVEITELETEFVDLERTLAHIKVLS